MIVRFVKMTFEPSKTIDFEMLFKETHPEIVRFRGCRSVELFTDTSDKNVYFTVSYWDAETDLNNYRSSDFFRATWSKVKPMFAARAEAWSLSAVGERQNE